MKKMVILLLVLMLALSLCACHEHVWKEADCENPKSCESCDATDGEAIGHSWKEATCTDPKTCSTCGKTDGQANGHDWKDATCTEAKTCSACGITEGNALGHDWKKATCTHAKVCRVCATTEGKASGHNWENATCKSPKKCRSCGVTEGSASDHLDKGDGKCKYCGADMLLEKIKKQLIVKLMIPSVGSSTNYMCQVEFINRTGYTIEISESVSANGKHCSNSNNRGGVIESGYKATAKYFRGGLNTFLYDYNNTKYHDMYLDNQSTAYLSVKCNGKIVYVKFGVNGVVAVGYSGSEIGVV